MNDLRFDLDARVEIWVRAEDIREHKDFAAAMALTDSEKRLYALRAIAVVCAQECVGKLNSDTQDSCITAYPTLSDVNIDRIDWQVLATPDYVEEFEMTVTHHDRDHEVYVRAVAKFTNSGWEVVCSDATNKEGGEADDPSIQEQVDEEIIRRAEKRQQQSTCDHDWKVIDDSFDHEFGTERVVFERCEKCDAEQPHESYEGPETDFKP
jgi:hypothetical protein